MKFKNDVRTLFMERKLCGSLRVPTWRVWPAIGARTANGGTVFLLVFLSVLYAFVLFFLLLFDFTTSNRARGSG